MPGRSRRIVKEEPVEEKKQCWCRVCLQFKISNNFFKSYDHTLDVNTYLSVCKECIDGIYQRLMRQDKSVERTMLKLCRMFNVAYDEFVVQETIKKMDENVAKGKEPGNAFGLYKMLQYQKSRTSIKEKNDDNEFLFVEPSPTQKTAMNDQIPEEMDYLVEKWGEGLNLDDYEFLEKEFDRWREKNTVETHNEITIVKELCYKQNQIRQARIRGDNTDSMVMAYIKIMKEGALTPALQNAASGGKNQEALGVWIRDIEEFTPAEWWEQQTKLKDMDGIEEDRADIRRGVKTYITGQRDYTVGSFEESSSDIGEGDEE